jgi:hypothetical protein
MTQTTAHFVFTLSGAGCLVRALRSAGRDDQVVVTFFDEMLTSLVTEHWRKVARIIGTAMADDGIIQSDDTFLSTRLDALARDGRLEIRGGSARDMHVSEVRLPGARQPS